MRDDPGQRKGRGCLTVFDRTRPEPFAHPLLLITPTGGENAPGSGLSALDNLFN